MERSVFEPKVTIVIPVYNGSNYLKNAIECALGQTYENLEVIVVNDGSNDGGATAAIARSFGNQITYYEKLNGGVSTALNYGIARMTGDYFSWLSHDDAYAPTKIADAVELLSQLPHGRENTIAYTEGHYIGADGASLKPFPARLEANRFYSGKEMVRISLEKGTLNGCCMLIPRSAFERCGGFNEQLRYSQDTLMWQTMFLEGFGLVSDEKDNVMYRLHNAQVSQTRHDLFEKDSVTIAGILAPRLVQCGDGLLYLYAQRMARYNCAHVVELLRNAARAAQPFTPVQELQLRLRLLFGRFRSQAKYLYYRHVLRVNVK